MRKHKTIGCVILSLALLLQLSTAAASAFAFRGGVTWSSTVADMLAAEGSAEGDGSYNYGEYNGFQNYYFKARNDYYVFRGDKLATAYALVTGGYDAKAAELTALYGAPADISADTVGALLNRLSPNSHFSDLTAWRLGDGTIAAVFSIDGVNYCAYFHEQRILEGT